ncbi:DUF3786 domain-containing protein [Thermodesulfobacteriota bacterium]
MATGACGINCDICRLKVQGICSTCGPGKSEEAREKLQAQKELLGMPCQILTCAVEREIDFCPRDCHMFPCQIFETVSYPFSQGYLNMQKRRREEKKENRTPSGDRIAVPSQFWNDLEDLDIERICENTEAKAYPPNGILVSFLGEFVLLDHKLRKIFQQGDGRWVEISHPLLELICLAYLINAGPQVISGEMVSEKDLKGGHFFTGPHELKKEPLLARYGNDVAGFRDAAEKLGGVELDQADAAFRFLAFPKIPVFYLLWEGDEEFNANLSILFDRSIQHHLAPDAVWGLVNLVSDALLTGSRVA